MKVLSLGGNAELRLPQSHDPGQFAVTHRTQDAMLSTHLWDAVQDKMGIK